MKQSPGSLPRTHALIERPVFAVVAKGEGHVQPDGAASREAQVREAAYARYEARGRVHGRDREDWLAAETALDAEAAAKAASSNH